MLKSFPGLWKRFAELKGRSPRRDFWFATLMQLIICAVLGVVTKFVGPVKYVLAVYALVCVVPFFAVSVRRLHDVGKSGHFLLLNLIPVIGNIIVLVFLAKAGNAEENQYGPVYTPETSEETENAPVADSIDGFVIPPVYRDDAATVGAATEHSEPVYASSAAAEPVAEAAAQNSYYQPASETTEPVSDYSAQPVYSQVDTQSAAEAHTSATYDDFRPSNEQPAYSNTTVPPANNNAVYSDAGASLYNTPIFAYKPESSVVVSDEPVEEALPHKTNAPEAPTAHSADSQQPAAPFKPKGYRTKGFPYGH